MNYVITANRPRNIFTRSPIIIALSVLGTQFILTGIRHMVDK